MKAPTRAELWMTFAAAEMGLGDANENTAVAAKAADRMMAEFDKRFAFGVDGDGPRWIDRPTETSQ